MTTIPEAFAIAIRHHQAGRLAEAEDIYRQILAADGTHAHCLHLLGVIAYQSGRAEVAIDTIGKAIAMDGGVADFHNNLGLALQAQGRLEAAAARYREAIRLRPDHVEAQNNLGNVLHAQGRLDAAAACYAEALRLRPSYAEAHGNLGLALRDQGRLEAAAAHCAEAVGLKPGSAEAHMNLGLVLQDQGRAEEAVARYTEALRLRPAYAEAHMNLGLALHDQGRTEEALGHYAEAVRLRPDHAAARFGLCMAQLPVLYDSEAEIGARRADYQRRLQDLSRDLLDHPAARRAAVDAVGVIQPFYLAYQGQNDRDLQAIYGTLLSRIMAEAYPQAAIGAPPAAGEPVRVGFVSGLFCRHSVWKIPVKGWLTELDRQRFQVFGYCTRAEQDAETETARDLCDRFVQGPLPLERWRDVILADAPQVLIYPELGMDPMSVRLAAQRLAPVQCTAMGHPITSGLPTIDYYLSSDLMEPEDAQQHYTEHLIRLPNLGIFYEPADPPLPPLTRAELGLRPDAVVYWCCQSLFKYLPQFDRVFPRIARDVGDCQFVFIQYGKGRHVTERFANRLDRAFADDGMKAGDHCVFLPELEADRFSAAAGLCDVFLDSIGWSGLNSILESLRHDLPVVILPGPLMRGRHGLALLTRMCVTETIDGTLDDYVAIAVRLGRDRSWRSAIRQRIAGSRHRLYRDRECIAALEAFLDRTARGVAGG